MTTPFATKQFEWAGTTLRLATTQLPFTASNSDDVFAPNSDGPPSSQPQFFIPNPLPFPNNSAYNHFPNNFHTPTAQASHLPLPFICDSTPHLPSPPPLPPHVHPTHLPCIHSPILHHNSQTNPHFTPGFFPQHHPPPFYYNPPLNQVPILYPIPNPIQNPVPIQYIYLPPPPSHSSEVTTLPSASKSLPTITSIPLLNIKTDFYAWDEGVSTLLCHLGILRQILDPSTAIDTQCPDLSPSMRPFLPETPSPLELATFHRWVDNDNVATIHSCW